MFFMRNLPLIRAGPFSISVISVTGSGTISSPAGSAASSFFSFAVRSRLYFQVSASVGHWSTMPMISSVEAPCMFTQGRLVGSNTLRNFIKQVVACMQVSGFQKTVISPFVYSRLFEFDIIKAFLS